MVLAIEKKFEDNELKTGNNFYVPDGWYKAMLIGVRLEDSPFDQTKPQDLVFTGVITEGEFQHTEFDIRLSINDETSVPNSKTANYTWAKKAHSNLLEISHAAGFQTTPYSDLEQLLKKRIMVEFASKPGNQVMDQNGNPVYKEDGTPETYPPRSFSKKYKKIPAVAGAATPATPAAQPVAQQQPPAQPPVAQPVQQQPAQQPMQPQQPAQPIALDDEIPF
jgi:hypothetical protein